MFFLELLKILVSFTIDLLNEDLPPKTLNQTTGDHVPAVHEDEEDEFEGQ